MFTISGFLLCVRNWENLGFSQVRTGRREVGPRIWAVSRVNLFHPPSLKQNDMILLKRGGKPSCWINPQLLRYPYQSIMHTLGFKPSKLQEALALCIETTEKGNGHSGNSLRLQGTSAALTKIGSMADLTHPIQATSIRLLPSHILTINFPSS